MKKKQSRERECFPCPFDPEWQEYQAEYREMPLCRLKAEKVFWEESRARLELDTLGKAINLFISFLSIVISLLILAVSAYKDQSDAWPIVQIIIGAFAVVVASIAIYVKYSLSNLEIDHRKAVWRLACIEEAIERKRSELQGSPCLDEMVKPASWEAPGYCAMHPRQTGSKPAHKKGEA